MDMHPKILRKLVMHHSGLNMQRLFQSLILQIDDPYYSVKQWM